MYLQIMDIISRLHELVVASNAPNRLSADEGRRASGIVELLISTNAQPDLSFLDRILQYNRNCACSTLIIHQHTPLAPGLAINQPGFRIINDPGKGLSRSRNLALEQATRDICVLADDDIVYYEGFDQVILQSHEMFPEHDIILFQVNDPQHVPLKPYSKEIRELNIETTAGVYSYEITFKRKSIIDAAVRFDERFGLGATFHMSEERIFIADCIKRGLKVLEIPVPIVMHPRLSTGTRPENKEVNQVCHGAAFTRIYGKEEALRMFRLSIERMDPATDTATLSDYLNFFQGIVRYLQLQDFSIEKQH